MIAIPGGPVLPALYRDFTQAERMEMRADAIVLQPDAARHAAVVRLLSPDTMFRKERGTNPAGNTLHRLSAWRSVRQASYDMMLIGEKPQIPQIPQIP